MNFCLCVVKPVLSTSVSAAVSYSHITVSISIHITYLNVMFSVNVLCLMSLTGPITSCHTYLLSVYCWVPTRQDLSSVVSQFVLYFLTTARVLSFDSEAKRVQASHGSPRQQFVYYQAVANR